MLDLPAINDVPSACREPQQPDTSKPDNMETANTVKASTFYTHIMIETISRVQFYVYVITRPQVALKTVCPTSTVSSEILMSHLMMLATDGLLFRFLVSSSMV